MLSLLIDFAKAHPFACFGIFVGVLVVATLVVMFRASARERKEREKAYKNWTTFEG